jgi:hypothetical protein
MPPQKQTDSPHLVTAEDVSQVRELCFDITLGNSNFEDFLNSYFPGLHLSQYLTEIDMLLTPLTLSPINKEIAFFETSPQMLIIQYYSDNHDDEEYGLALSRTFIRQKEELIAEHEFLRIPRMARRKGVAKLLLNLSLQQYLLMRVNKIKMEAALENGGYVWAKALFTATEQKEVETILNEAAKILVPKQFNLVKRVYDNYYDKHPNGKNFPMIKWSELLVMEGILSKSRWHGEIDLNDIDLLTKFKHYVA